MVSNGMQKQGLVFLIFCLCTLVLRLFYITNVNGPFVYADEFGYWAHAAHMTGNTWAGVMDGMGWYGFGYSFLLAPSFLLSNDMAVIYKAAVIFNVVLSVEIYGLAYLVSNRVFSALTVFQRGMIALVATSFSTYIFYSYVTMCETLLTFLIWLVFYDIMLIEENSTWWNCFLLGIALGFAYMVHNRMLSMMLAAAFCMILFLVQRKVNGWNFMAFGAGLVFMFILNAMLKTYFCDLIENNGVINALGVSVEMGSANSMGGQAQKILGLLSLDGLKQFVLNIAGQIWECLSATYLLFGCGMVYAVYKIWQCVIDKKGAGKYLFPVLAMLLSIAMTGVFCYQYVMEGTSGKIRMDPLFYGRYNACFVGIFILFGVGLLAEERRFHWRSYLTIAAIYIGLSAGMFMRLGNTDDKYLNVISAIGIHIFHWLGEFSVWKCTVIALLGCGIIVGLCCFKRFGCLGLYAGMIVLMFLFSTTALHCMRTTIRGENDYTMQYKPLFDYLNENTEKDEIVYITANGKPAFDLQSRLVDKPVVVMWGENLDAIKGEAYAVIRGEELENIPVSDFEICLECEEFLVLRLN